MRCRFYVLHKKTCLGGGRGELLAGALLDATLWQGTRQGDGGSFCWDSLGVVGEMEGKIPGESSGCVGRREQVHADMTEGRRLFQGPGWTLWGWFNPEAMKPAGWHSRACRKSPGGLARTRFLPPCFFPVKELRAALWKINSFLCLAQRLSCAFIKSRSGAVSPLKHLINCHRSLSLLLPWVPLLCPPQITVTCASPEPATRSPQCWPALV